MPDSPPRERESGPLSGPAFLVEFWISDATPRWRISTAGESFGGVGDSRQDAIDGATAKLVEWAREPWGES